VPEGGIAEVGAVRHRTFPAFEDFDLGDLGDILLLHSCAGATIEAMSIRVTISKERREVIAVDLVTPREGDVARAITAMLNQIEQEGRPESVWDYDVSVTRHNEPARVEAAQMAFLSPVAVSPAAKSLPAAVGHPKISHAKKAAPSPSSERLMVSICKVLTVQPLSREQLEQSAMKGYALSDSVSFRTAVERCLLRDWIFERGGLVEVTRAGRAVALSGRPHRKSRTRFNRLFGLK
jgi:hypothetical protein